MDSGVLAAARARAEARRDEDYESFLAGVNLDAPKDWAQRHRHFIAEEHDANRFGVKETYIDGSLIDVRLVQTVYGLSDYEFESIEDAMDHIAACRRKVAEERAARIERAQRAGFRVTFAFPFVTEASAGYAIAA